MPAELFAWISGSLAGSFTMSDGGAVTFRYEEQYRHQTDSTPMSLAMPKTTAEHRPRVALPWLAGLLPDSPDRLAMLASEYRTTAHPFRLLQHVGAEAAGAAQLLPVGARPSESGSGDVERLSADDLSVLVDDLRTNPTTWGRAGLGGRWSLAGAQSKIALIRFEDGSWGIPRDATPTTHILKPAPTALPDHDVNEFVTMAAAARLGLNVAPHELLRLPDGSAAFVASRYDRTVHGSTISRVHQEDLCQALGVLPAMKYQADGGPSVPQIARLLATSIRDPSARSAAQHQFFDALAFNYAVLGTDAHAKNYSLLLDGGSIRMAPLYDLGSHTTYAASSPLESAMSIGDETIFDRIGDAQFIDAGKKLAIAPDDAIARLRSITGRVAEAYRDAATLTDSPYAHELANAIEARSDRIGWAHLAP